MTTTNSRIKDAIITDLKQRINDLQKENIKGAKAIEKLERIQFIAKDVSHQFSHHEGMQILNILAEEG